MHSATRFSTGRRALPEEKVRLSGIEGGETGQQSRQSGGLCRREGERAGWREDEKAGWLAGLRSRLVAPPDCANRNGPPSPGRAEMSEIRSTKRDIQISRALSKLLRHRAAAQGLAIDSSGYVSVSDVLQHNDLKCNHATVEDLRRVVETNDKQRFRLAEKGADGALYICALQGHSMAAVNAGADLQRMDRRHDEDWPQYIVHGTYRDKLPLIKRAQGLSRMGRNHVHFSYTLPEKFQRHLPPASEAASPKAAESHRAISGMRSSCQVALLLDVDRIRNSELEFYRSANGVILSAGDSRGIVDARYIAQIVDSEHGVLSWTDVPDCRESS